jgi:uncharacterized 2Fe-2S/4Fe-4S cluster protein (DUF4445 family)
MSACLDAKELAAGWRLACLAEFDSAEPCNPVEVEFPPWQGDAASGAVAILGDEGVLAVEPREGLGAVVDVGTTTLVAQAVDLASGLLLSTESALNAQSRWGADLMSRIHHELQQPGELTALIRQQVGELLTRASHGHPISEVLLVGNTVMHHLFCGLSIQALAAAPFRTPHLDANTLRGSTLGWTFAPDATVTFLPNLGSFVGSDVLAGLAAVGMESRVMPEALLDLGTNGEIALATEGGILCASTAAGPAFEAANIRHGMRAAQGAIHRVDVVDGQLRAEVLGNGTAYGVCGSGLVDAVACALDTGMLSPRGRLRWGLSAIVLADGVVITQRDIRELQLAKAAIASGLRLLQDVAGTRPSRLHLAGAFGNYLRPSRAVRIGLLPTGEGDGYPPCVLAPAGNTALRGARMLLLAPNRHAKVFDGLRHRAHHVELAALPRFQEEFVDALLFPEA